MLARDVLANAASVVSVLIVLFAAPLILGSYVATQRGSTLLHAAWFAGVVALLVAAFISAVVALVLLG